MVKARAAVLAALLLVPVPALRAQPPAQSSDHAKAGLYALCRGPADCQHEITHTRVALSRAGHADPAAGDPQKGQVAAPVAAGQLSSRFVSIGQQHADIVFQFNAMVGG